MINKMNIIIFKTILLKKNIIKSKNNKLQTNFDGFSSFFFKTNLNSKKLCLKIFENNFKNLIINNNNTILFYFNKLISIITYRFFFILLGFFKKKKIIFNKIYLNSFIKLKNTFTNSLYLYYIKNDLFFYKNFNKIYLTKYLDSNFSKNQNKKHFFKLKKKEHINPHFFFNFNNVFNKSKDFNKFFYSVSNYNFLKICENLFYFSKSTNYSKKSIIGASTKYGFKKFHRFDLIGLKINSLYKHNEFNNNLNRNIISECLILHDNPDSSFEFIWGDEMFNNVISCKSIKNTNLELFLSFKGNLNFKKINNYKIYPNKLEFFFSQNIKKKINNFFYFNKINQIQQTKNFDLYNLNIKNAFMNLIYLNDFYDNFSQIKKTINNLINNNYFMKIFSINDNMLIQSSILNSQKKTTSLPNIFYFYNNYYPIFYLPKNSKDRFFLKFKFNLNINYLTYMQFYILSFLENFFKKRFYIKTTNNFFQKPENTDYLLSIYNDYKNFQPKYMKNFLIRDFLEIVWYSFFLRDLTLLVDWVSKFLEASNFRVHKRFLLFFHNFMHKYSNIFFDILRIRGFFFDIRGKVGVTGNSKKRHFFLKIGKLNKSTKIKKMDFNQSIVRTPSGALGLTFILNY